MLDFRPVCFIIGILLTTLALAMLIPAAVDLGAGSPDWEIFLASAVLTLFIGGSLILTNRTDEFRFSVRQTFLLTTLSWAVIAAFGALPLSFSTLDLSYTDAFFEAMSGVTTTGSTVIVGLDAASPGLLIWRALLQWLGGIGVIVMAIAVLPMLRVGGMQLFHTESSDVSEKVLPRTAQIAAGIGAVYLGLSALCAFALWLAGMSGFDAVAHTMTAISTAGFSTKDLSIAYFDSALIDAIITVTMILGGMPFVLYLQTVRGDLTALLRDSQVHWFLTIIVGFVAVLTAWHALENDVPPVEALRYVAFNSVSLMTGTGYTTAAFDAWGGFAVGAMLYIMVVGGCAGSTTCGIKIFRFQVIYATARVQVARLTQPHGVFIPRFNEKPIPETVSESVMGFFFLFALCFAFLALGLGALGLDFLTSVSGAATAIANVGPGLGPVIGPAGNFASLPDEAKWLLSFGMLLGRLELYTVLVLFAPSFWRH